MELDFQTRIEEAALNAYPAPRQVIYDGWLLRFTGGEAKRANSVNVLYPSSLPLSEKIAHCEALYALQGLPTIFRTPDPFTPPELPGALEAAGFHLYDPTFVLGKRIDPEGRNLTRGLDFRPLSVQDWIRLRADLGGKSVFDLRFLERVLQIIVPEKLLGGLFIEDQPVACGIGVQEGNLLGYFSIFTRPDARRQGYAAMVMDALRDWGTSRGATYGYLQVEGYNAPALGLYEKMGFETCYRYVYWKKK